MQMNTKKCLEVLEYQLTGRDYIINDYSIADIISWPWVLIVKSMGISLDPYPNVIKWRQRLKERDAVRRGVDLMRNKKKIIFVIKFCLYFYKK
jgi:GST-like protein